MFSTGDAPDKRLLRVQLDFGNYSCWTRIPKKFRERELRIKAMPSIGELDELSRVLLGSAWQQIPVDHHGANCYGAPNNARVLLAFDDGSQLAGVGVRVPRKVRLRLSRYSYVGSTASLRVEDLLLLSTGD